jgi:Uma2 family endonuclease
MSVTRTEPVSEETFRRLALGNPRLELHYGQLREKPGVSVEHASVMHRLLAQLYAQLDRDDYEIHPNFARLRRSADTYYIPELVVIPAAMARALRARPGSLDAYSEPPPFVVEIWSPSTGEYDVDAKIPAYQRRGDAEIWRIHPYERTVTVWRRMPDGAYSETIYPGGIIAVASLAGVTIDLAPLFAE